MNDLRNALTFVQGAIIAVLLAILAGRVIGPLEIEVRPLEQRVVSSPTTYQRTWTPMRRD